MRSLLPILIGLLIVQGCSSYPAPVVSRQQPSSARIDTHRVESGETLYSIAWRYDLSIAKLAEINRLKQPYIISPGQVLSIRPDSSGALLKPAASSPRIDKPISAPSGKNAVVKVKPVKKTTGPKLSSNIQAPPWRSPVEGEIVETYNPQQLRKGLTFKAAGGSSVRSVAPGLVVYAGDGLRDYGKLIIIKHSEKLLSAYGHSQTLLVKEGDSVDHKRAISKLGAEGRLYFEIRKDGEPVNPKDYLK